MLFYVISVFSIAIFGLTPAVKSQLPVTICKRDSVDHSACLESAIKEAWPQFVKGLPEFDFPSLDPLFYKYGTVVFNTLEITGKLNIFNLTAIGLSNARFSNVRTHYINDIFRLRIDGQVPSIFVEGGMQINGSINVFRIVAKGHFNITVDDVRGTWDLTGSVVNDTWIVEHFRTTPSIAKLKLYADNFIEGNKELDNLVLVFVNEFWPVLYRVMLPIVSEIWDPWLTEFPNKIFSKVSFSKVFP